MSKYTGRLLTSRVCKPVLKLLAFFLCFVVLFNYVQSILRYKWENSENVETRYKQYNDLDENSVDIIFCGSSDIYASMYPIVMYEEYGITGFNLGISGQTAMTEYYMLEYALEHHMPKVVVIGLCGLTVDRKCDNEAWESTYRKVVETMPDRRLKNNLIKDIVNGNENQTYQSFYMPLLRYHDRWCELVRADFDKSLTGKEYSEYTYGALMNKTIVEIDENAIPYSDDENIEIAAEADFYLKKVVELCKENGIHCVALNPPSCLTRNEHEIAVRQQWCNEQEIPYIDYDIDENFKALNMDLKKDFYNEGHLNVYGGRKASIDICGKLIDWYGIQGNMNQNTKNSWDKNLEAYHEEYAELELIQAFR